MTRSIAFLHALGSDYAEANLIGVLQGFVDRSLQTLQLDLNLLRLNELDVGTEAAGIGRTASEQISTSAPELYVVVDRAVGKQVQSDSVDGERHRIIVSTGRLLIEIEAEVLLAELLILDLVLELKRIQEVVCL